MRAETELTPVGDDRGAEVLRELVAMAPLLNRLIIEGLERRRLTQARVRLLLILFDTGPLIMTELAKSLGVTPRAVTAVVDGLDRTGYVRRSSRPTDRRATVVGLTLKGRRACADMRSRHNRWADNILGDAPPRDLDAALRILASVRADLEERRH
jgi:DNA-binding MarR family transcriptional regulator